MGISYNRQGNNIKITITENDGAKLEELKCNNHEKKKYADILRYLKDKYGFVPEIDVKDSINKVDWFGSDF